MFHSAIERRRGNEQLVIRKRMSYIVATSVSLCYHASRKFNKQLLALSQPYLQAAYPWKVCLQSST